MDASYVIKKSELDDNEFVFFLTIFLQNLILELSM